MDSKFKSISFIGTGIMGNPMVGHLLDNGYHVNIYTRTKSKAENLIEKGAIWHDSVESCIHGSQVVFSIVGFPSDVLEIGKKCMEGLEDGSFFVDMTTSSPKLAMELYEMGKKKGIAVVDAPVSGGPVGAQKQTLSIMVGGDEKVVEELDHLLRIFGTPHYHGPAGNGQKCKIANQIFIASGMIGIVEGLFYAEMAGLSPVKVLETCSGGAAGSWGLNNYGPKILKRNFDPGFLIEHFVKDLRIALDSCKELGINLRGCEMAESFYAEMVTKGEGKLGTQSLILALERLNNKTMTKI